MLISIQTAFDFPKHITVVQGNGSLCIYDLTNVISVVTV